MILTTTIRSFLARAALGLLLPFSCLEAQTVTNYGTGCFGMSLTTSELPDVTTAPFNFLVTGIPAGSILNILFWSYAKPAFPFDLAFLGAPGCWLLLDQPVIYAFNLFPVGTTETFTSGAPNPLIYNTAAWVDIEMFVQAVSLIPLINAGGFATSNGVALVGG